MTELDTRLEAGAVVTDRERFLLGVIRYFCDQDHWYLTQVPKDRETLQRDFGFRLFPDDEEDDW